MPSPVSRPGSSCWGRRVGAGLAVVVDRLPERPPEFRRSHPRAHVAALMALTGVGFLLAFLRFGLAARLPLACFFIAVMLVVAFIDWELMIIPNKIVLPATLVGLAASIALNPGRWWVYLVAAVGASLFLFILALIWPGGMGGGDIKLALFMGGVLGTMVIAAMFLAFLFGAVDGAHPHRQQAQDPERPYPVRPVSGSGLRSRDPVRSLDGRCVSGPFGLRRRPRRPKRSRTRPSTRSYRRATGPEHGVGGRTLLYSGYSYRRGPCRQPAGSRVGESLETRGR